MNLRAGMVAIGVYRPARVVPTEQIAQRLGVDSEWVLQRTGIKQRRYAGDGETVITMAAAAAEKALAVAGMRADQIDALILATSTHLNQTPAAATSVAGALGCSAAAFDVSAGCAGYAHAIGQAAALVNSDASDAMMVIGAEKLSAVIDPADRSVAPIFGDGAGAAIIARTQSGHIGRTVWGSCGDESGLIRQAPTWEELWSGSDPSTPYLRIIDSVARRLDLPVDVVIADDLRRSGNTSAAALPLAVEDLISSRRAEPGQYALQVSFGAGLSYAGQTFALPPAA